MRFDTSQKALSIDAAVGIKDNIIKTATVKPGERIAGWVFNHKEPVFLTESVERNNYVNFEPRRELGSAISLPLKTGNHMLGVLNISRYQQRKQFQPTDTVMAQACAAIGSMGIERTHMADALLEKDAAISRSADNLRQAAKLSHVGYAACALIHDIHNPLGIIAGYTALLSGKLQDPLHQDYLTNMNRQIERIKALTGSLQERFQCESQPAEAVDVPTCINDALVLVRRLLVRNGIEPVLSIPADLPKVYGRRYQLERLFMNILQNALQAMEHTSPKMLQITAEVAGTDVAVHVQDSGPGIAEIDGDRIFEPFYSTKGPGTSMGMGLSICRDIVRDHHGTLTARNHAAGGAVFTVTLPLCHINTAQESLPL
jgi:C4-dicarboxylate-specific signal transduction histidine kinase